MTLEEERKALEEQRRTLERLAHVDGLTSLSNRRHFDDMLQRTSRRCLRTGEPLGLALIDIDHFKQYNDHYGHQAGDDAHGDSHAGSPALPCFQRTKSSGSCLASSTSTRSPARRSSSDLPESLP